MSAIVADSDRTAHEAGILSQYDTDEKLKFYAEVMGDGTNNIHFGKWDGVDIEKEGAYGEASERMTDYMWDVAFSMLPKNTTSNVNYIDLGSGTGSAVQRLVVKHSNIAKATCLNLCTNQNKENQQIVSKLNIGDRVEIVEGTYEKTPFADNTFDMCFSQDAFVHAFSKLNTFKEALRITKDGGVFIFCDLMCGDGDGVSAEELATFASTNMVQDWLSPAENVKAMRDAGWADAKFIDLTPDIKMSFQLMLKKVTRIIDSGKYNGIGQELLQTYKSNLEKRVGQVDRGVFKWGVCTGRKADAVEMGLREDLSVAHKATAHYKMDDLVWNHISARYKDGWLITPGRMMWSEIEPHHLEFASDNCTADIIHSAVYKERPDVQAVIHLHTPYAVAVSCLETGFVPYSQDASYFYKRVAYHEWEGVSNDASEADQIQASLRTVPGCNTLVMRNHGFVCFGKTVAEVWVLAYQFEKACKTQLLVQSSGQKPKIPGDDVMSKAYEQSFLPEFYPGECEWKALTSVVKK